MKRKNKVVRIVVPIVCMAVLTAGLLWCATAARQAVFNSFEQPVEGLPEIASKTVIFTDEQAAISVVESCADANGEVVAYRVQTAVTGYNSEVPIKLAVTVSADTTVLRGIEVLSQKESEYYGARIKESSFKERFKDRVLPMYLTGEAGRGSHVDGIAGATVTSQAVVKAVNDVAAFVQENYIQVE